MSLTSMQIEMLMSASREKTTSVYHRKIADDTAEVHIVKAEDIQISHDKDKRAMIMVVESGPVAGDVNVVAFAMPRAQLALLVREGAEMLGIALQDDD